MQVLDQVDDHVGAPGDAVQAPDHAPQQPLPRLGADLRGGPLGVGNGEEVEDQRQIVGEVRIEQQQPPGDLLARDTVGIAILDPEVSAQHLEHGQEGDRFPVRLGLGLVDIQSLSPAALGELVT